MITRVVLRGFRCFESLDFEPRSGLNILVGGNEAGKSTVLEAILLALTGRSNGRWVGDELNPHWFNQAGVAAFFRSYADEEPIAAPRLSIELYLDPDDDELQPLRGVHNDQGADAPGVMLRAVPSADYARDFDDYMTSNPPAVLPVEYYEIEWYDFSGARLSRRPRMFSTAFIDSRTLRATAGLDHHTRDMLSDHLSDEERIAIALEHRRARQMITDDTLGSINERIAKDNEALHDRPLGLQMDQSARASWESGVVPQVDDIPFALAGQGQQAAIKVALAMSRTVGFRRYVLIEEPENHLSHTSLVKLVRRIETLASDDQQLFVSTHSSYVLNRLGLDALTLLHGGKAGRIDELSADTVKYFRRLSGYDTLRIVVAEIVVLVEGPSDAILFWRAFHDATGETLQDAGIDVISMNGLTFKRAFELCQKIGRRVVALRDNDGRQLDEITSDLGDLLDPSERTMFIGSFEGGTTLEPQIASINGEDLLRRVLGIAERADPVTWMTNNKSEAALRILDSGESITYPSYVRDAITWLT